MTNITLVAIHNEWKFFWTSSLNYLNKFWREMNPHELAFIKICVIYISGKMASGILKWPESLMEATIYGKASISRGYCCNLSLFFPSYNMSDFTLINGKSLLFYINRFLQYCSCAFQSLTVEIEIMKHYLCWIQGLLWMKAPMIIGRSLWEFKKVYTMLRQFIISMKRVLEQLSFTSKVAIHPKSPKVKLKNVLTLLVDKQPHSLRILFPKLVFYLSW